jgi:predicted TIM-barrel fold metal-dependent hydrolase
VTRFVDVDVHPPRDAVVPEGLSGYLDPGDFPDGPADFASLADYYRGRDGIALVHALDAGSVTGVPALTNRALSDAVDAHGDALAGLGSVDPHRGAASVTAAHDVQRMGLKGLYFHPAAQQFEPSARRYAPLWEMAEDLLLPAVIHCGSTILGRGKPGGGGIRLRHSDPMEVDVVAARHPRLQVVLTGVTPPWEEAAVAVAEHKHNVHLAPSGRPPSAFGAALREGLRGSLMAWAMCGTGFPFVDVDAWLDDWDSLNSGDEADRAVLVGNAAALFGL